jgi:SAM-dependent methyltransferase
VDAHLWDERYAASRQWSVTPNQFVAEALARMPPGRALDLACGEGRNAVWLAARGWSVMAIDFSAVGVERGREAAREAGVDITWVVDDVLTCPLPDVDLVVIAYLQLPAEERSLAVRRAWDALAPGGSLVLIAHDSSNLTEGSGGPQDPALLYTADDVLGDLEIPTECVVRAGKVARTVSQDDEHGRRSGPERPAVAWDALVHAVKAR